MDWGSKLGGHWHKDRSGKEVFVVEETERCGTPECPKLDELTICFKEGVTLREIKRLVRTIGGKLVKVERMWCSASAAPGREGQLMATLTPSNKYFDLIQLFPKYQASPLVASVR